MAGLDPAIRDCICNEADHRVEPTAVRFPGVYKVHGIDSTRVWTLATFLDTRGATPCATRIAFFMLC